LLSYLNLLSTTPFIILPLSFYYSIGIDSGVFNVSIDTGNLGYNFGGLDYGTGAGSSYSTSNLVGPKEISQLENQAELAGWAFLGCMALLTLPELAIPTLGAADSEISQMESRISRGVENSGNIVPFVTGKNSNNYKG